MLLCERALTDSTTGCVSLINIYGETSSRVFPFKTAECCVYARLTDGDGRYEMTLLLVRRHDLTEAMVFRVIDVDIPDPVEEFSILIRLSGMILTEPGYYDLRLMANGRFVHSVSLHARRL